MNKRAGSEMWWIIIGAVIALIVLIVLLVLFTEKTNVLEIGLTDCEGKGGSCDFDLDSEDKCQAGTLYSSAFECKDKSKKCCIGI